MDNETKDILMMLLEKMDNIGSDIKDLKGMKTEVRDIKLSIENEIKPTLQSILENQTEVINQKSYISKVETKVDEVKDDVDVLKIVAQEHSKDIEQLKKRA